MTYTVVQVSAAAQVKIQPATTQTTVGDSYSRLIAQHSRSRA